MTHRKSRKLQSSRQPKKLGKSDEDIISGLPDSILCHILSFLPTKIAVGTSILSKRWIYVWTCVPNLYFDDWEFFDFYKTNLSESDRKHRVKLFKKYVKRILFFRGDPIKRLRLMFRSSFISLNFKKKLICSAIMHHVEELEFENGNGSFKLPEILFSCGTLKILKLVGGLILEKCGSICLPRLKILHLGRIISLHDDVIRKIISGSLLLEELSIYSGTCYYRKTLCVQSSSLKSLVIHNYVSHTDENNHYWLVLDAPSLELLELSDHIAQEYNFEELHSLVEATVSVSQRFCHTLKVGGYGDQVFQMLSQISNVKYLNLSEYTLQALSKASCCHFPCFHNLTYLEVGAPRDGWFMLLLFQILRCSPSLKMLFLNYAYLDDTGTIKHYIEDQINNGVCWEDIFGNQSVPQCLVSSPERIEFSRFEANEAEENLKLIEYMLMNATVLKELAITVYGASPEKESDFLKKLVMFPRASSTCRILFSCSK